MFQNSLPCLGSSEVTEKALKYPNKVVRTAFPKKLMKVGDLGLAMVDQTIHLHA